MSNTRGNNRARSCNVYEQQKLENIERNKRKLAALNIPAIVSSMVPQGQPKKTSKVRYKIVEEQFVMIVLSHTCHLLVEKFKHCNKGTTKLATMTKKKQYST
jgi:hypothetical protein